MFVIVWNWWGDKCFCCMSLMAFMWSLGIRQPFIFYKIYLICILMLFYGYFYQKLVLLDNSPVYKLKNSEGLMLMFTHRIRGYTLVNMEAVYVNQNSVKVIGRYIEKNNFSHGLNVQEVSLFSGLLHFKINFSFLPK